MNRATPSWPCHAGPASLRFFAVVEFWSTAPAGVFGRLQNDTETGMCRQLCNLAIDSHVVRPWKPGVKGVLFRVVPLAVGCGYGPSLTGIGEIPVYLDGRYSVVKVQLRDQRTAKSQAAPIHCRSPDVLRSPIRSAHTGSTTCAVFDMRGTGGSQAANVEVRNKGEILVTRPPARREQGQARQAACVGSRHS